MQKRQRPDCIFSKLNTQPTCTPVYASPQTSRWATQNSGPSGSLFLSRRTLSFPASCRFIPAHCIGDLAQVQKVPDEYLRCFLLLLQGQEISEMLTPQELAAMRFAMSAPPQLGGEPGIYEE